MAQKYSRGLQKQVVTIAFEKGLQERADSKMLDDQALAEVVNCDFERDGVIKKRTGFTEITTNVIGNPFGSGLGTIRRLMKHGQELLIQDSESLWSFSSNLLGWKYRDSVPRVMVDRINVAAPAPDVQTFGDSCVIGNFLITVYQRLESTTADYAIYYSVYDLTEKTWLYSDVLVDVDGKRPRILGINTDAYIFYEDFSANELMCSVVSSVLPGTPTAPVVMATNIEETIGWDVSYLPGTDRLLGVWCDNTTSFLKIRTWTRSTKATFATRTGAEVAASPSCDGSSNVAAVAHVSGSTIRAIVMTDDASLTVAGGPTTINTTAIAVNAGTLRVRMLSMTATNHWAFWSHQVQNLAGVPGAGGNGLTYFREFSGTAAGLGVEHYQWSIISVGKPFKGPDSRPYIAMQGIVPLDGITLCTWDTTRTSSAAARLRPVAHFAYGEGTSLMEDRPGSIQWDLGSGGNYWFPGTFKDSAQRFCYFTARSAREFSRENRLLSDAEAIGTVSLSVYRFDFEDTNRALMSELGECTYNAGGLLTRYDEQIMTEPFFVYGPRIAGIVSANTGGSMTSLGVYRYAVVYEYLDQKGQRDISQVSLDLQGAITLGATDNRVTLNIIRMVLSNRMDEFSPGNHVKGSIYRTQASGDVFYFVASKVFYPGDASTWDYTDTASDLSISDNEQLYTTGGELENEPPPASRYVTTHWNRLLLISTEKLELHWSKPRIAGRSIQFSRAQVTPLPEGEPAGIVGMDSVAVYFNDRGLWLLEGEGPGVTGADLSAYRVMSPVSGTVGCSDPRSIVKTPLGIFFRAKSGFKLFTRDYQIIDDIGFGVSETSEQFPITIGADCVVSRDTVYWAVTDSNLEEWRILVYNWAVKKWSIWTTDLIDEDVPTDAFSWKDFMVFSHSSDVAVNALDLVIFGDTNNSATPVTTYVSTQIVTSWLKFGQVESYKRIWRMILLAKRRGAAGLKVEVRYAYTDPAVSAWLTIRTWTSAELDNLDPVMLRHHMAIQKTNSIQFRFTEIQARDLLDAPVFPNSQGLEYNAIDFELGIKRGMIKMPAAQST